MVEMKFDPTDEFEPNEEQCSHPESDHEEKSDERSDPNPHHQKSDSPADQKSDSPADQKYDSPEDQQSDSPEDQQSDSPEDQQYKSLEDQQSDSPEYQQSDSPEDQQSDSPVDHQSDSPEDQQSDSLEDRKSDSSEDRKSDSSEDRKSDSSEDQQSDSSEDQQSDSSEDQQSDSSEDQQSDLTEDLKSDSPDTSNENEDEEDSGEHVEEDLDANAVEKALFCRGNDMPLYLLSIPRLTGTSTLISSDNKKFEVERRILSQSQVLAMGSNPRNRRAPRYAITSRILSLVIQYLTKHAESFHQGADRRSATIMHGRSLYGYGCFDGVPLAPNPVDADLSAWDSNFIANMDLETCIELNKAADILVIKDLRCLLSATLGKEKGKGKDE